MNFKIHDYNTETRIVESDVIIRLKNYLKNKKCDVSLHHVDKTFWDPPKFIGPTGCIGARGPTGATGFMSAQDKWEWEERQKMRPIEDCKNVLINISFEMSTINALLLKPDQFNLTSNCQGKTIDILHIQKIYHYVPYTCGVYKRPGFDKIYDMMKEFKPHLTEKHFASNEDGWDEDLVEERFYTGGECIDTYMTNHQVDIGTSKVTLRLLEIDLYKNLDYIKTLILC